MRPPRQRHPSSAGRSRRGNNGIVKPRRSAGERNNNARRSRRSNSFRLSHNHRCSHNSARLSQLKTTRRRVPRRTMYRLRLRRQRVEITGRLRQPRQPQDPHRQETVPPGVPAGALRPHAQRPLFNSPQDPYIRLQRPLRSRRVPQVARLFLMRLARDPFFSRLMRLARECAASTPSRFRQETLPSSQEAT